MYSGFPLPVTAVFASLSALILIYLAFKIIRYRRGNMLAMGDGDNPQMARFIRGHSNAAEWMPIVLILMAVAEGLGLWRGLVVVVGLLYITGRILHAYHFTTDGARLSSRTYGMILTFMPMMILVVSNLVLVVAGAF